MNFGRKTPCSWNWISVPGKFGLRKPLWRTGSQMCTRRRAVCINSQTFWFSPQISGPHRDLKQTQKLLFLLWRWMLKLRSYWVVLSCIFKTKWAVVYCSSCNHNSSSSDLHCWAFPEASHQTREQSKYLRWRLQRCAPLLDSLSFHLNFFHEVNYSVCLDPDIASQVQVLQSEHAHFLPDMISEYETSKSITSVLRHLLSTVIILLTLIFSCWLSTDDCSKA